MYKQTYEIEDRSATLYTGASVASPLIILNTYSGDGSPILDAMRDIATPDCSLLVVSNLDWHRDMTPWDCRPLFNNDTAYTGGADTYLELLLGQILPRARELLNGEPSFTAIAGYSLAGLFALWAACNCNAFSRIASMSGSLWYPGFAEYASAHEMPRHPDKLYLSLGSAEARTPNRLLRTVRERTEEIAALYREQGIDVTYELNPGNHFKDADLRTAKGIKAILV